MRAIHLNIIDQQQNQFSGDMCYIRACLRDGDIGITPGHAPLISTLKHGTISARDSDGNTTTIDVEGGFIEVQPTHVTILTPSMIKENNIQRNAHENYSS